VQVAVLDARPQHHHLYNSGSGGVAQAEGAGGAAGEPPDMRVEVVAGVRELALTRAVRASVYPYPPPLGFPQPAA